MTKTIDIHTSLMSLEELALLVRKGAEIILTDASTLLARLIPVSKPLKARIPEFHARAIQTSDDFDKPLPDEFWIGNE